MVFAYYVTQLCCYLRLLRPIPGTYPHLSKTDVRCGKENDRRSRLTFAIDTVCALPNSRTAPNSWFPSVWAAPNREMTGSSVDKDIFFFISTRTLPHLSVCSKDSKPWSFLPLLALTTASFGMVAPSAAHGALEPLGKVAGVGGGLLAAMHMLFAAGTSSVVAMLFPRVGVIAMTGSMCTLTVLALALAVPLARRAASTRATDSQPALASLH